MSKHRTFEKYFTETTQGVKVETDLIEFSVDGIQKWSIWSSVQQDWIEVSIFSMMSKWPGKYGDMTAMLIEEAHKILNEKNEYEPKAENA